ncbi:protein NYNRIN-like [Cucumis melo var. makuwa]|uniref:Protein NYNRIN-like n=1 Tax=Cucumis melo var. makuwa TaxID=1194695 RepID=A0A5D3E6I7_CUCMM|nr:protein NYNRIN-like [Cucumis melo var. makuwa]TYK31594.1 protein NYNRIN-like [Cucumis melo var. makuwa]
MSKTLNEAQENYTTIEKELLVISNGQKKDAKPVLIRWVLLLQEFDLEIVNHKDQILRRCVPEYEKAKIIANCHEVPYEGHFGRQKMAGKCQRTVNTSHHVEMPQQPIIEIELFDVWGIDFMGSFLQSGGHLYILLVVDYVLK